MRWLLFRERLGRLFRLIRAVGSYERYLQHHYKAHPGSPPLSRREFYLREQERQWNGINRCC